MAGIFHLPGWAIPLARRALYFWLRTTVFPENSQELGLDPAKPVCYVLQDHHLSNQLVLFEEAERRGLPSASTPLRLGSRQFPHSAFSLNRKHSLTATARERYAHPEQMTALVRQVMADPEFDVQIVPVVILWGRRPDKQESILKALFSEAWRQPGPIRRLLTILLHGRNVLIRFNTPISLNTFSREELDENQALRKLSRVLRVHYRRQREMAIGPDLSHRYTQIDTVLAASAVRLAVTEEAKRLGIAEEAAGRRARSFALEIASDYSYSVVRAFEIFLTWLWTRLYDGIEVHHVDELTRIAPGASIVYVPAHRSHVDYLLLSYLLHENGFMPPHIAAGANLNMPIVGALLRRCGAFFLRRTLKGEPLYAAVFHEYLHTMLTRGFPLEYFIEGGRSRGGRTLKPKAGILGMTVRSYLREHTRPLIFVPVYIGYEKVIEGQTYVRELAGKPKQKESLWGLLKSARAIKRVFGKVHVNFGKPLALAEFLETRAASTNHEAASTDAWSREVTQAAALELARRLNDAAVINPINLIALALLSTPRHTADEPLLERLLAHYRALLDSVPYSDELVSCPLESAQIIAQAERLGFVERIAHPLGELIRVPENVAAMLAYFRNNVLHVFALPALLACLLSQNRLLGTERINNAIDGIYALMGTELFLHWPREALPAVTETIVKALIERGLLQRNTFGTLSAPEANSQEFAELRLLGETIRPLLERHFLLLSLLQHHGSGKTARPTLENECHLLAQRLMLLYDFGAPEPAEKTSYSALIAHLIDSEFLREDETGLLHFDERISTPLAHAELVLPAEVRQAIGRLTRAGLLS